MQVVVEYLVILPKDDSFCDGTDALTRLLRVDSKISLKNEILTFENSSCDFRVASGEVADKEQRFFHLRMAINLGQEKVEEDIAAFTNLLKRIRVILAKAGGISEVLWDDISFRYSKDAYARIYEVENMMRKLIANFMLINVGKGWVDETAPSEFQEVVSKSKRKDYVNILHTVDFIHLVDFLTKAYSKKTTQELHKKIESLQKTDAGEKNLQELQEYVPRSNWQRYFSSLVDCEDSYLSTRWKELYELRCKVAHNAIIAKADIDRISALSSDLKGKLEDALLKLPQVSIPQNEREFVAENAASNINSLFGEFIVAWRDLEAQLVNIAEKLEVRPYPIREVVHKILEKGLVDPVVHQKTLELMAIRNEVVHGKLLAFSEADLRSKIKDAKAMAESFEAVYDLDLT